MKKQTIKEILQDYKKVLHHDITVYGWVRTFRANRFIAFNDGSTINNLQIVVDFENFDERLSVIDCIVVNIIGVEEGFIEFIPDNNPPLEDEILCWIWAFRPDLTNEILEITKNEDLKFALNSYLNNSMDKFWNYIS